MSYHHNRNFKGRGKTRFKLPGSWHKARAPDVLYSDAFFTFSSGETQWYQLGDTGVPTATQMQPAPAWIDGGRWVSTNQPNNTPTMCGISMSDLARGPAMASAHWLDSNGADITTSHIGIPTKIATEAAGPMNVHQWASIYKYMTCYKTVMTIEFLPLFRTSADAGVVADLMEDQIVVAYCMRNAQLGDTSGKWDSTTKDKVINPFLWNLTQYTTSQVLANSEIKYTKMTGPNTVGGGTKIKVSWSLRNQKERNMDYMLKNVSESIANAWTPPKDLTTAFYNTVDNAPVENPEVYWAPTQWFQWCLLSRMGHAAHTYKSKYRVNMWFKYKCWEILKDAPTWQQLLANHSMTTKFIDNMDEEVMDCDDEIESTPLLSQLAEDLSKLGYAKTLQKKA